MSADDKDMTQDADHAVTPCASFRVAMHTDYGQSGDGSGLTNSEGLSEAESERVLLQASKMDALARYIGGAVDKATRL